MRWCASLAMFRCRVSMPSAILIACLYASEANAQTPELFDSPIVDANPAQTAYTAGEPTPQEPLNTSFERPTDQRSVPVPLTLELKVYGSRKIDHSSQKVLPASGKVAGNSHPLQTPTPKPFRPLAPAPLSGQALISSPQNSLSWTGRPITENIASEKTEKISLRAIPLLAQAPPNVPTDNRVPVPENLPGTQPDPNRDRFLQPTPQPAPEPPKSPPEVQSPTPQPSPAPSPTSPSVPIPVTKIEVRGSTILKQAEIDAIMKPLEGRSVTLEELRQAADKITEIYLERGYITSRAVIPQQTISGGLVQVQVIEGRLARIEVVGTKRLNPSYVRSRVRLGAGMPLSTAKLEDQLRLLRVDPLFENVEASLRAGENEGESILIVRVTEANPFQANFSIDNYSPPSVGSERLGVNVRHRNITGRGDELAGAYYRSLGDSDVFDFSYRLPLNAMNGTLQLWAAPNRNSIVQAPFDEFDISGKSHLFELSYRQPLIRSPIQEFAVSIGFTYQWGRTFLAGEPFPFGLGPGEEGTEDVGITSTSVIKIGQDYIRRDVQGAWALRSQFSIGTGLFDATTNQGSTPDGQFLSWLGQIQRVQRLNDKHLLIIQADLQLAADSLLPSQQFVIGGGQSLRGYRQNVRSGDNGFRFSIEDRITLERDAAGIPTLQIAPFFDMGTVWNASGNPNQLLDQKFLAGLGLGVIWEPIPRVNVRLDYGLPLINLSDRGQNAQDSGFYFSVIYSP